LAGFAVVNSVGKKPYQRVAAEIIAPHVAAEDDITVEAFMATDYRGIALLLYHDGRYWESFYTQAPTSCDELGLPCRAVVLAPGDLQKEATKSLLPCLENRFLEITDRFDERIGEWTGWRLFVNPETKP
jgi:hypothetical protein